MKDPMSTPVQKIVLTSDQRFGRRLPPRQLGLLLAESPGAVLSAISMALRNRGSLRGCPAWLKRAGDIRFVDHHGDDQTILVFEAPPLGEAVQELYQQAELWQTRPDTGDTGFDLLGDVLAEIGLENADSDRFDIFLLRHLLRFRRALTGPFQEAQIECRRFDAAHRASFSPRVLRTAERFCASTPAPRRIRLVGTLDMVRASNQTFGLKLDEGEEIRGVLLEGSIEEMASLLNRRVLVLGKSVYRPSGRVLRIDSEEFRAATERDDFFSRLPEPPLRKLDLKTILRNQEHKKGLRAIFGKWPGNETDEQIDQAMKELS
jgi:hypothetical protein